MTTQQPRKLGEFFRIKHGYAFKGEFFSDAGPYVLLTPGNFHDQGGFKLKGAKEKYYIGEVPEGYILDQGSLLVAMTEQAEGLLGSSALIPDGDKYLHNQRLGLIIALNEDLLDKGFLYYLFNTPDVRAQIRATANGAKVRHTSPARIYDVEAVIPAIQTQRRIASTLSAYDDLIENNTRRIAILEEMARGLYEEWFVHFRFPGHEVAEFIETEQGRIPDGWRWGHFSDLAVQVGRSTNPTQYPEQLFAQYSFPAFDASGLPEVTSGQEIKSNKTAFSTPVVLMAKLNPRIERVWPVLNGHQHEQVCSTEFIPLAAANGATPGLIEAVLRSTGFRDYLAGLAGGTSTSHQRVKPREALAAPVPIAPEAVLSSACRFLDPIQEQREKLKSKNANLRAQRDLLLPKLVSGEIDVSEADKSLEAAE